MGIEQHVLTSKQSPNNHIKFIVHERRSPMSARSKQRLEEVTIVVINCVYAHGYQCIDFSKGTSVRTFLPKLSLVTC